MPKVKSQPRPRACREWAISTSFRDPVKRWRGEKAALLVWRWLEGRQLPGIDLYHRHNVGGIDAAGSSVGAGGLQNGKMPPWKPVLPEGNDQFHIEPNHTVRPLPHRFDGIDNENLPGVEQGAKSAWLGQYSVSEPAGEQFPRGATPQLGFFFVHGGGGL